MVMVDMFEELDAYADMPREEILKPPFTCPGAKTKSVEKILQYLPKGMPTYVEPFGGTGVVLLSKHPCRFEVFNDRHSGITDFYKCVRDRELLDRLVESIELSIHSREMFKWCHDTWENQNDVVERAFRWYYMTMYSFSRQGRHWARSTNHKCLLSSIRDKIPELPDIHERLKRVQIDNADYKVCIADYDSPDTLFYMDPPYLDAYKCYKYWMTEGEHKKLLNTILDLKGVAVVSGYPNPMYDEFDWDESYEWDVHIPSKPKAFHAENRKEGYDVVEAKFATEKLWIKY
jgi:DNA adenine methylase